MIRAKAARLLLLLSVTAYGWSAEEVVDFENAVPLLADSKANRVPRWEEKGVVFTLAREPQLTKGRGQLMFFTHLSTGHKGIVCAMATEPIPVRATFPKPVSSVTVSFWGSIATPVLLEAFDVENRVVDRATLESVPSRKAPGDPIPTFSLAVRASRIAYVQFSGPREGEYLAADEVRFTPIDSDPELTDVNLETAPSGCGTEDPITLASKRWTTKKNFKHVWKESGGGHSWPNWQV